ncbi:30S ribosomal protein S17 [Mesomycoplasma molare]|uniref:Small ribosomal subunit protein uS17 n=1 Tax=Mesomycoplasma molare TaxID=171288 RepID=A0ABY5TYL3_9BACT|nr:30S ribosomal protein S17 [Mesomycoplasma molare]UWD34298.1 30S ribosomal protein S17 [Mesomycoplasma molare]
MERKNTKKTLIGKVVSDKNQKTIIVAVDTYVKHPLYGKRFKVTKRFATHDEKEEASLGDIVKISETRPFSKTKTFRLVEIREKAKEGAK